MHRIETAEMFFVDSFVSLNSVGLLMIPVILSILVFLFGILPLIFLYNNT